MADNEGVIALKRRARRRLVGASALVLLMVIVPPLLMDSEPKPASSNLSVDIPSTDQKLGTQPAAPEPAESARPELPPPLAATKPEAKSSPPTETKPQPNVASNADAKSEPKSAPKADAKAPSKADAKSAAKARDPKAGDAERAAAILAGGAENYIVQLGVFLNQEGAQQVRAKVAAAGVKVYAETVKQKAGEQTRLRAGPFPSRDAAEKARTQLEALGRELNFKPGPVQALEKRS